MSLGESQSIPSNDVDSRDDTSERDEHGNLRDIVKLVNGRSAVSTGNLHSGLEAILVGFYATTYDQVIPVSWWEPDGMRRHGGLRIGRSKDGSNQHRISEHILAKVS